ncbi:MAG TPA: phosphatase PAP2 family protein [Candidatus Elarobacter sp.]|nr:phosphatase PAP2 family protein [Candidatus Elarobacter sp.]
MRAFRYFALAVISGTLYALLGNHVSHLPPHGIDLAGRALAGQAPRLALIFTASCWWPTLLTFAIVAIVVAVRYPAWRERVIFAIPTTLVTWQISDALKNVFHRPRPGYWILIHEPSFAYSSGHAMFAVLVYWLWAWFMWNSGLPYRVRIVVAPLLALWGCGVIWSRLALGAHYATDLIGGVLLAVTALSLASAIREALRLRVAPR